MSYTRKIRNPVVNSRLRCCKWT